MQQSEQGFTLIELIAVIILLSLLSIAASSRLDQVNTGVQAGRDDLVAALFLGQQIAMSRDSATNPIRVVVTATAVSVTENGAPLLYGGVQYPLSLPNGVQISPAATLNYDKLGRTSTATFLVSEGSTSMSVSVSDSGYAN